MDLEGAARRPYSRRAFLLGAVSATAAGVLAACQQPAAAPTSAPAAAPTTAPAAPASPAAAPASPAASPAAGASPSAAPAASPAASPSAAAAASAIPSPSAAASPSPAAAAAATPVTRTDAPAVPAAILADAKQYAGQKVVFYGDGVGPTGITEGAGAMQFSKDTGIQVQFVQRPSDSTESLALYQRFFQGQSPDIDAFSVDVVWPGVLAPHLVDLSQTLGDEAKQHYPGIIQNNTVNGKLVAMPYFSDFGMLYYRTDLLQKYNLKVPETWDDIQSAAMTIVNGEKATSPNLVGFVFQGKAYEGLTCNALEWLASSGGGTIVDSSGKVTVNNPQATAMLNKAKGWIGTIAPQGVTTYQEEDARTVFTSGNAAFMRNWPYAYSLGNANDSVVKGKFDIAPLPAQSGSQHSGTIGGWGMSVSRYSKAQDPSIQLVRYFTSPEFQTWRAQAATVVPTIQSVADNPQVLAVEPYLKTMADVERVGRPSAAFADQYNQASTLFFQGVSQVLAGQDAAQVLPDMQNRLQRLMG